jgi:hypothetical protein
MNRINQQFIRKTSSWYFCHPDDALSSSACMFSKNMDQSLVPDAASQVYGQQGTGYLYYSICRATSAYKF